MEDFEDAPNSSPTHHGHIQQLGKLPPTQTPAKAPIQLYSLSHTISFTQPPEEDVYGEAGGGGEGEEGGCVVGDGVW
jgi:hypothetical protein